MKYKRNDSFQLNEVAGDYLLIARGETAIDFSSVVLFNETGVFLWQHMDAYHTPEELADMLVAEWDAPADAALADVRAFLEKMRAENMILTEEA